MELVNNSVKLFVVVVAIKTLTIQFTILFGPCVVVFWLFVKTKVFSSF
jgi:hypothetical protein